MKFNVKYFQIGDTSKKAGRRGNASDPPPRVTLLSGAMEIGVHTIVHERTGIWVYRHEKELTTGKTFIRMKSAGEVGKHHANHQSGGCLLTI